MPDLIDEVKISFEKSSDEIKSDGPLVVVNPEDEFVPGFFAMRSYYEERITVLVRRGYRHFAGAAMPEEGNE